LKILPIIDSSRTELFEIFKDFHTHPELGFNEVRTSKIVGEKLKKWGIDEIHYGLGGTGVVGIIHGMLPGNQRVGLRADMDALPIHEETNLSYKSKNDGVMHACGHDGHTTMLLGAAKHLASTRNFTGTVIVIFQPAEEGLGGARKMLSDGLFDKFPCDEIYGIHNWPNGSLGHVGICKGRAMAGSTFFDIKVNGTGSHAAMPHQAKDPLMIAATLVSQLQTIVSRNVEPIESCVVSVTKFESGSAYNVVPDTASLCGTIRYFSDEVRELAETRMIDICDGLAKAYDVEIGVKLRNVFNVLINDVELSDAYLEAAADIVGPQNVTDQQKPVTGSEDFADMLQRVPGAYCIVGHGENIAVHNPEYSLDPEVIPIGASILARVAERRLAG